MKYIPIKLRRKTKEEKGRQGGNWRGEGEEERVFYYCLFFLATLCGVWDLSSPTRGQTYAPCSGSLESQPLDHQGSPLGGHFRAWIPAPDLSLHSCAASR